MQNILNYLSENMVIVVLCAAFVVLIVAIALGSYHHVHKAAFKPNFIKFSDGSLNMEFYNFGGVQTERTKRFYEQYKIGTKIQYGGKHYEITQLKEISDASLLRPDVKIVAYLTEV